MKGIGLFMDGKRIKKRRIVLFGLLCISLILCGCSDTDRNRDYNSDTDQCASINTKNPFSGPEMDLPPEEFIAQNYQNLLKIADGKWTSKIFYQGYHVLAPTFLPLKALDESWEKIGTTKPPVYPWEKHAEDFVTNCVPEGCEVFLKEEEFRTLIAIKVDGMYYVFQ